MEKPERGQNKVDGIPGRPLPPILVASFCTSIVKEDVKNRPTRRYSTSVYRAYASRNILPSPSPAIRIVFNRLLARRLPSLRGLFVIGPDSTTSVNSTPPIAINSGQEQHLPHEPTQCHMLQNPTLNGRRRLRRSLTPEKIKWSTEPILKLANGTLNTPKSKIAPSKQKMPLLPRERSPVFYLPAM